MIKYPLHQQQTIGSGTVASLTNHVKTEMIQIIYYIIIRIEAFDIGTDKLTVECQQIPIFHINRL